MPLCRHVLICIFSYHKCNFVVVSKDDVFFQGNIHINHPVFTQRDRFLSRVRSDAHNEAHPDRTYLQRLTLVSTKVNMQCITTNVKVPHRYR